MGCLLGAAEDRSDADIVQDAQAGKYPDQLKRTANPLAANLIAPVTSDVCPPEQEAPCRRPHKPCQHIEHRGFASAVGADERNKIPLVNREAHVRERNKPTKPRGKPIDLKQRTRFSLHRMPHYASAYRICAGVLAAPFSDMPTPLPPLLFPLFLQPLHHFRQLRGVQLAELSLVHRRRSDHHELLCPLARGERDHIADVVGVGQQHHDAIDPGRDAAVRRRVSCPGPCRASQYLLG